eukprot:1877971-Alexandrium_andersonii.AAC.1
MNRGMLWRRRPETDAATGRRGPGTRGRSSATGPRSSARRGSGTCSESAARSGSEVPGLVADAGDD